MRRRAASDMSDDTPRYMISVAADLVGMHPQTLRIYETKGLVTPQRTAGNTRLYSDADLERLRLIQQLTTELGLNLAGVEHVIRLEEQIRRMQRTMERLEREMRETIAQVHKQYRRDLVPYDPTGVELVPKTMDFQRLTVKSQEAIAAAQELARRRGNPEIVPDAPAGRAPRPGAAADAARGAGGRGARQGGGRSRAAALAPGRGAAARRLDRVLPRPRPRRGGDAQARGRVRLDGAPAARARRRASRRAAREAEGGARRPARHVAGSRRHVPGAREVRPRPDRARRAGQARPGHRPRRGDSARDPGAVAAHEEQPGADRRPRSGEDRDRRGPGAADRRRRRARRG